MDPNSSLHSSTHSSDTDILIKIPNNFFDPNLEKSHFSNENDFMTELDNFLTVEQRKDVHNSTCNDYFTYDSFRNPLNQLEIKKNDEDLNLQEEQLKRKHYEQLSSILQKKILQYQQKMELLNKMNREKDQVIYKLRKNEGLDIENNTLKQKLVKLEQEISEAIHLANKLQSMNEVLELKIENLTITSTEMRDLSKQQIKDLEIRLSNSIKVEKEWHNEIEFLKSSCKSEKDNFLKEKNARSLLDREVSSLKSQIKQIKDEKIMLHEKHAKEKQNIDMKQKKIFSNLMKEFSDKERKLIKELDMQRMALKNYYQAQLESALEVKVADFQEQLEKYQDDIKQEADKREKTHNERAINQMEMIIRKNEEEIDLINQKCTEEIELYKVQLLNATRHIETLESKLNEYQIRRHDIAENLHSIMETQWKKTLEILTNPSKQQEVMLPSDESESDNNHQFQHQQTMNILSKSEENLKSEMLRNYIDMLLKQSPKSEQVNEEKSSHRISSTCSRRASIKNQTPWK